MVQILVTSYQKRSTPYFLNYIYSGQFFNWNTNTTQPNGGIFNTIIKTSDAGRLFHLLSFDITGNYNVMSIGLYEGATYTGGTASVPKNSERRSAKNPDTLFYTTPTIVTTGTQILSKYMVTYGSYASMGGVYSSGIYEMVLKKNTNYLFRVEVQIVCTFSISLNFYESGN